MAENQPEWIWKCRRCGEMNIADCKVCTECNIGKQNEATLTEYWDPYSAQVPRTSDYDKSRWLEASDREQTQDKKSYTVDIGKLIIVLLGKTGSGKSATGNSLLSRPCFDAKFSGNSVTRTCKVGTTTLESGVSVDVIDTPGLCDTQLKPEETKREIERCVGMSLPGPHVFLLTLELGRITNEEIQCLELLCDYFGENIYNFSIIVFTHSEKLDTSIQRFIAETGGKLKKITDNCKGRFFAINNNATGREKQTQTTDLYRLIKQVVDGNCHKNYTNEMYKEANAKYQEKLRLAKEQKQREEQRVIDEIKAKYDREFQVLKQDLLRSTEEERKQKEKQLKKLEEDKQKEIKETIKVFDERLKEANENIKEQTRKFGQTLKSLHRLELELKEKDSLLQETRDEIRRLKEEKNDSCIII